MDFYTYSRNLPHWRTRGVTYFVTFRVRANQPELSAAERNVVLTALRFFDGDRYVLGPHVVMNDHVHALVAPAPGQRLTSILHSWKSFTAHTLQRAHGRVGAVWQQETFDRIVRGTEEYAMTAEYVLGNPWKRWPELRAYAWVAVDGTGALGDAL